MQISVPQRLTDFKVSTGEKLPSIYFSRKEQDEETGFYYYGARYLNPRTSMWISADPAVGDYIPTPGQDIGKLAGMGGVFNYVNMHVYHYAGNNPVKFIDPNGETATWDIDDTNKTVNINVDIVVYGIESPALADYVVETYKKGIEDAWSKDASGNAWQMNINGENYSVNFQVNITTGEEPGFFTKLWNALFGTTNYIHADINSERSEVFMGFLGTWRTTGRNGTPLSADNPAAHEFGHLIGFRDRYTDVNGQSIIHTGWGNNLMGDSKGGSVEQRNLNALGNHITAYGERKGKIYPWWMLY
jgi:RHS repeat-associated protein